jgi:hypothetical protein
VTLPEALRVRVFALPLALASASADATVRRAAPEPLARAFGSG